METTQNLQSLANEQPQICDIYDPTQQNLANLDYFLSSQSPIQLNTILSDLSILEMKVQAQEVGFPNTKMTDPTLLSDCFNDRMESELNNVDFSAQNKYLQKNQNHAIIKSYFGHKNIEKKARNSQDLFSNLNLLKLCNQYEILKEVRMKGKYHKNTNVSKILVRIYLKYFAGFMPKQKYQSLKNAHMQIKKNLQSRETNNYKIQDVLQLLNAGCPKFLEAGLWNREAMSRIILQTMSEEVILNNFVKGNKMSYMIAMKIYALRCRSPALTERVKIL